MNSFLSGEPLIVLMVEDNLDHAELVMRNLREHLIANRVIHLLDGQIALDYLFRRGAYADPEKSPRPHLVLLDLRLPRIDGLEVLKTVKESEELRSIPVVILTTSEGERDVARAYQCHANSYLVKPIEYADFVEMMRAFGFYWLGWNTQPY
jgi:CheY-like chemotaxis protein